MKTYSIDFFARFSSPRNNHDICFIEPTKCLTRWCIEFTFHVKELLEPEQKTSLRDIENSFSLKSGWHAINSLNLLTKHRHSVNDRFVRAVVQNAFVNAHLYQLFVDGTGHIEVAE